MCVFRMDFLLLLVLTVRGILEPIVRTVTIDLGFS